MLCRVKPNCLLPHDGGVLDPNTDVELRADVAYEVRHLVDEVTATGELRPIGTAAASEAALKAALATARPHERISLLEAARATLAGDLTKIDAQIAAERKRLETEAKAAEKADKKAPAPAPAKDEK